MRSLLGIVISPSLETIFPKYHILQQEVLEKLLKDNLELVTFLLLERGDKSGYKLLKDIAQNFHCILSQGTLYPLLYQLEKENRIMKQNGKGREVIYSLTQETKNELKSKKETCLKSYQHLASFFESGGGVTQKIKKIIEFLISKQNKRQIKMVNKMQKHYRKEKEEKAYKKSNIKEYMEKVSKMRSDIKTFIDNFKSDVDRKKKAYQLYTEKFLKKKLHKK